jgi:hypothetical protein
MPRLARGGQQGNFLFFRRQLRERLTGWIALGGHPA